MTATQPAGDAPPRRSLIALMILVLGMAATSMTDAGARDSGKPGSARAGETPAARADERPAAGSVPPPPATRAEDLTEEVHGVAVGDPYRWLENGDAPETGAWVDAQNGYTRALLDARPGGQEVRSRLARLLSIGTISAPAARGGRYFFTRREGEHQNQPILYVREGLRGKDRVLVDPNRLSEDGTAALDWWYPSEDGTLLAYGVSTSGDEKSTLRVAEVATGRPLPDVIPHTRYATVAWLPDDGGFYYTRYPIPGTVPPGQENYNSHVFFHRLGTDWKDDPKIFGEGRKPEDMIGVSLSPDGRWLLIQVNEGWSRADLYLKDLKTGGAPLVPVAQGIDALFSGEVVGDTLFLLTNWEAPRYRLFAVDVRHPERDRWKILIPETDAVLNQVALIRGQIVALYTRDASSRVEVLGADGKKIRALALPALGTVNGIAGRHDQDEAFFDFSSYAVPPTIFRFDARTGRSGTWERVKADVDLSRIQVRQVFYPSKDGTRVSMFVVHRKGLKLDGRSPAVLYGYGGFNIAVTPDFSRATVLWLERGGVYAEANLRGGGEYGEEWHKAGMRGRKQNVFDDFIAAAEHLIGRRYTSPDRLAIYGGSNGGLLVGAALTQRPDLYRAVVCAVPLLDMVRYQNYQIARLWIPEYGSSEDPEQFKWLYAYSPYHRVKDGAAYPAVLLTAAESDSRVDPMHARKMAARLQAATSSGRPVLLRLETRAGHGAGKPLTKQIDEAADIWTFLLWQLGVEVSGR